MSIVEEFKTFAMRGNVIDLAVGVVIGTAFGKIVNSLVGDIVMPVVGALLGGVDFKQYYLNLGQTRYESLELAEKAGAPIIKYGVFINTMVDFIIIAFAIFMVVKVINKLKRNQEAAPPPPAPTPEDIVLLREIRDALKR